MRIGIVADDFPPNTGGMAVHAEHVATELARSDDVVLFTLPGLGLADAPFEQRLVLTRDFAQNAHLLAREKADAWLFLNAGYAAIAREFMCVVFVYFHGNDFLKPYTGRRRQWLDVMNRLPYVWRYYQRVRTRLRRSDIRRGLRAVAEVFTNSAYSAGLIKRLYARDATVAHPGVGDTFFQDGRQCRSGPLRLLTVSRLPEASRKNVDGVLRAVAALPHGVVGSYSVVGDGKDRPRLEQLSRELGISDRVTFRGRISNEELLACYRDADLFVLAPKATPDDVEGFGIVYVEASASGTPVLGSAQGGATDAIRDGVNGILIPESSPQAIADGIERFSLSRKQFSTEGVVEFAKQFRWPVVVGRMRERMREVVESG